MQELDSFDRFSSAELTELLAVCVWEEHAPGALLSVEGEGDATACVIIAGNAAVQSGSTRVARLRAGASFGDFGLVESGDPGAQILATTICTIIRISSNEAERLSPGCARRLYRLLATGYAGRLQQLQRRIRRRTG